MLLEQSVLGRKVPDRGLCIPLCIQRPLPGRLNQTTGRAMPLLNMLNKRAAAHS